MEYINIIFDEKRHGLNHLARNILLNLDYFSFIQVIQSAKILLVNPKSENIIVAPKMRNIFWCPFKFFKITIGKVVTLDFFATFLMAVFKSVLFHCLSHSYCSSNYWDSNCCCFFPQEKKLRINTKIKQRR